MTVRLRLALWNVAVLALALVALGVVLRARVKADLAAGIDRELVNRAGFWREPPPPPGNDRPPPPEATREMLSRMRDDWRARHRRETPDPTREPPFFDADGRNLITDHPAPDLAGARRSAITGQPAFGTVGEMRYYSISRTFGGVTTVFQTGESLAPIHRQVAQLTRTLLTLLPLALGIAAAGGLFLTDRALRPVRDVTEAAAQIGAGDLSRRLPAAGRDEFARLSSTFNGMLARLEDAFGRQKRFVADASHELKTPLTVIKANSSLALADPDLPADVRETLSEIDGAADRTIRIAQDLLLLARSDADALPLQKRQIAVRTLFENAVRDACRLHPGRAAVRLLPGESDIVADPDHLHRLLLNLLDNALRHTPREGAVTLSASHDEKTIQLTVADTGPGIAPEHLPRLGERFYRPDNARARQKGGTGLGLAISRAIAEAHGGTLTLDSAPGRGTVVRIELPAQEPPCA